jgi:hypothetical protein
MHSYVLKINHKVYKLHTILIYLNRLFAFLHDILNETRKKSYPYGALVHVIAMCARNAA